MEYAAEEVTHNIQSLWKGRAVDRNGRIGVSRLQPRTLPVACEMQDELYMSVTRSCAGVMTSGHRLRQ